MSLKSAAKFCRRTDVKMTLWYILTFSVSALLICSFLYVGLKRQLLKEIDRFLLDETTEMEKVLSREPKETDLLIVFEDEVMSRKYYPLLFRILDARGEPLFVSSGFKDLGVGSDDRILVNARERKETRAEIRVPGRRRPFRIISTPVYAGEELAYIIQVGTHLHFLRKNMAHFKNNILAALPIMLVLGSLGGWMLARKSLAPIGYIASKAQSMSSRNLSERLSMRGTGDEMDDLIRTINEMIARLETSFTRMAEFTADTSHELKTPLCAMRGEAEVLLSKERASEEYQEALVHFVEQFDHLNQMINDLILLSKFDSSQIELKLDPLRLDLLLREICSLFQILAEQRGLALEMDKGAEVTVAGDKTRLQQLFTNLLDNAIKYTSKGSIQVRIERDGPWAAVRVQDTGIGIPPQEQEKIFKRFYRVDKSRSRETGGVGLGLSIVEWIVNAHHGRIEVESVPEQGSTFTVYLPISEGEGSGV
jgi:heavy metal sensor kinase